MAVRNLKDTNRVLFFLALLVMAMVYSCGAQDYCHAIVPCDDVTCPEYCAKMGFKSPLRPYCKPGQYYPSCCCHQGQLQSSGLNGDVAPSPAVQMIPQI